MKLRWVAGAAALLAALWAFRATEETKPLPRLSDYGFFSGALADLNPAEGVLPYDLNTPLFSNYAEKARFVKVPVGKTIPYNDSIAFDFPQGTVLIKNFYYPNDFRNPAKGKRIIETRLLVHTESGWQAWPYVWNDEQTEAYYEVAGETKQVAYVDKRGKKVTTPYLVPNKNQCKGCHSRDGKMVPLGPTVRNLNGHYNYAQGNRNQLAFWREKGWLTDLPEVLPAMPRFDDATAALDLRARAYLDVNCGHCHHPLGPASTSGLYLDWRQNNPAHLGINKSPVAAGRGSGDLPFDIVPGSPQHSILLYRMKTNDPGIAMPEIGREQIHQEGVALIDAWIRIMK
ncbi:MAG: SO2930 family diheme c-type cytochrome [Bacteroidota bacterium]